MSVDAKGRPLPATPGPLARGLPSTSSQTPHRIQSPANVYQWRCSYRWYNAGTPWRTYTIGFDMNRACRWTYGGNAYAGFTNYSNPYSWRCYR